jgi:membrane-associated phospholipid phosphatase
LAYPLDIPPQPHTLPRGVNSRRILIVAVWSAAFLVALGLDRAVSSWVHDNGIDVSLKTHWPWFCKMGHVPGVGRLPGNFLTFPLIAAIWMFCLGRRWWPAAGFVFLSGVFAGANVLVKWLVGRARPFQGGVFSLHPFVGGIHGMGGANQSFPSGDVCLGAATAVSLAILLPRWRWLWISLVVMVAAERILENAHYPSDTVAAVGLGWLLAQAAWWLLGKPTVPQNVRTSGPLDI